MIAADGESAEALELLQCGMTGRVDIAISTRARAQLQKLLVDPDLAAFLAKLPELKSPGRWSNPQEPGTRTTWGSDFYWADGIKPKPYVGIGSQLDDDIIDAHRTSGRDYLVTLDRAQLQRAKARGISGLTPAEMLAVLDGPGESMAPKP